MAAEHDVVYPQLTIHMLAEILRPNMHLFYHVVQFVERDSPWQPHAHIVFIFLGNVFDEGPNAIAVTGVLNHLFETNVLAHRCAGRTPVKAIYQMPRIYNEQDFILRVEGFQGFLGRERGCRRAR